MEQVDLYREHYPVGSMARLALEMGLNIAARRHDAYQIGRQHLRNGCLSWQPAKTSKTTGKMLTIRILPGVQAALDAMPRSDALAFLLTEDGEPFASSAALATNSPIE
jgi:integrase/recombinase XerD